VTNETNETTTTTNRCYRHPDRESFVRCQRCGRTICPQCQTQAAVGVHCPECVREARGSTPRAAGVATRTARFFSPTNTRPVVTYTLIGIAIFVYIIQVVVPQSTLYLEYHPGDVLSMPWTIITVNFVHGSVLHILFNMYSLYAIGPVLENYLGRGRYLALFLISGIGAVLAADLFINSPVVGASGAIFGLLGALFIVRRRLGIATTQLVIVLAINLALGFVVRGIAWQAHVGGLIVGAAIAGIYLLTRNRRRFGLQVGLLVVLSVVLLVALALNAFA
jgi:membrane associated rhomboid family serine protease